jgi:hypothetical protein
MIHLAIMITIGAVGVLCAGLFWFLPRLTRHDLYFAVTVAPGFRDTPPGRAVLRRYRAELLVFSGLALARLGQGGDRGVCLDAGPVGDRTPDKYWKLGIFYFHPEDPAVLIEKRFGLGYTMNFARPATWIILGLILLGAVVPIAARLYLAG